MITSFLGSALRKSQIFSIFVFSLLLTNQIHSQWVVQNAGSPVSLATVCLIDSKTVLAGGTYIPQPPSYVFSGYIFRTTNSGTVWNAVFIDSSFLPSDIEFINSFTGFAFGGYYGIQFLCYRTTDSGVTWDTAAYDEDINFFKTSACFTNALTGFSCGANGLISKTTNSGSNWAVVFGFYDINKRLNSIQMIDALNGWCVGDSGVIVRTTNGGTNWASVTSSTQRYLSCVKFLDLNTGYISGDTGLILKTSNSGSTWSTLSSGTTQDLGSIAFTNQNTGFIVGGNGLILHTTSAGSSWFVDPSGVTDFLHSVKFIGPDTGYIVGDNGRILRTTTGGVIGIKPVSNIVPKEFSLEQNYPNPFNPTTKFKFQIAKSSYAKVSVYDVLGREVETLVSQQLNPGTYEMKLDASNLPSGVYFYRLIAGDFAQTKKMALIK